MSTAENSSNLRELAEQSHAWPFEEARKIVARLKKTPKDEVIFETGYGPSGLPHIGTFGEVARTTMVRHAFRVLTDDKIKTRLIAFSDDMDGLRKVPDNVPNKEMVAQHLGKPLTQVPDPFGTHDSFAAHNNARLRAFLDRFGFDYEFMSSTECYTSGRFDAALLKVLERFDAVMSIMLPSLREERAELYSPFLPISPRTGIVLQVPVVAHDAKAGTITYEDPDTKQHVTTLVTGGRCKLQWKPDWAMRWVALGVDYEMAGKDLIDSVKLSGQICRALGGTPPEGFNYELFLDENGQKISKSKGNGLTIDEWLRYASPESLSLFMYREPKAAKRLYFDVIPRHVDEYLQFLDAYPRQGAKEQLGNPVWHIHSGAPPKADNPVPFAMLLSLVTASNAENAETLWGFIGRYRPGVTKETHPHLAAMVEYAIHYFRDFVQPAKKFREPSETGRAALIDLRDALSQLPPDATPEAIQDVVYEVGRREPFLDAKKKGKDGKPGVSLDWFNMLYQVLLGQERGPRFGSFAAAYGIKNTVDMIDGALARGSVEEVVVPSSIETIIRRIEEFLTPLDELTLSEELNKVRLALKPSNKAEAVGAWAETLAFALSTRNPATNPWRTYFGPMGTSVDKEGKIHYFPDINGTPAAVIDHWIHRANSLKHPVLVARYADLAWEFSSILGERARDPALARKAIDAYLASAKEQFRPETFDQFDALERALSIAIILSDTDRIDEARAALMALHRENVKNDNRLWWRAFDRLIEDKRAGLTEYERGELVGDLEKLVTRFSETSPATFDPHATESAAKRLVKVYSRERRPDEVKRLYVVIAKAFEHAASLSSPMLAAAHLQTALTAYESAGQGDESRRVRIAMQHKIGEFKDEIQSVEVEITIKKDDIDKFTSEVIVDDLGSTFLKLALAFLPKRKALEDAVQKMAEEAPLMAHLSQKVMSDDRVTAVIGSVDDDLFGRLFEEAKFTYNSSYIWMLAAFNRLFERHDILPEHFVGWANRSGIFDDMGLLLEGVRAWFQGDYVKTVHVLVPQIELGLRNISAQLGKPATKSLSEGERCKCRHQYG